MLKSKEKNFSFFENIHALMSLWNARVCMGPRQTIWFEIPEKHRKQIIKKAKRV